MANMIQKIKTFFGRGEDDEYDNEEDMNIMDEDETMPVQVVNSRQRRGSGNVVNLHGKFDPNNSKLIVYRPVSYDDTLNIIEYLRNNRPVIVNMEGLDREVAQRILDVVYGAICAVNGRLYKVNGRIFVISPADYDVVSRDLDY